jgi:TRAP-type C4-dicarboxylate transport system permease small subunit
MRPPSGFRHRLRQLLQIVVLVLMTALAVVVVVGVGFRKAGAALVWYDEAASILLAWLTYYGACLAALEHAHIGFPKLVGGLAPGPRTAVVLVREVCVVGFFLILAGAGLRVQQVLIGTYLVSMPSIPTAVAHSVIPIGALLFVLAELSTIDDRLRGEPDTVITPAAVTGTLPEDRT